jgi:rhodanese-related sulfurtransferase
MSPEYPPQISVEELARRLKSNDAFVLLDVRETWELQRAAIQDARLEVRPLSELAKAGVQGLPLAAQSPDAEIYVLCHQGVRSADVTSWLVSLGWTRTFSVSGGIEAYSTRIDSSVGSY